jgi:uncharacterized protein
MAKPAGAMCNMACRYCYYLEKKELYADTPRMVMTDSTLELYVKRYLEAQTTDVVNFTWHGGEALMRPLSFYKRALELQQKYAAGRMVVNCLQTNGTLLDDDWCRFLRTNNWLVGVSIDGPQEFHDEYRRNHGGKPSFLNVMRGIRLLQKHGVDWNAMAVINDYNADYPLEFYRFFKDLGCHYIQFTPIVERITADNRLATVHDSGELASFSVTPEQWGNFLCALFDEWVKTDVGTYYIQLFDATLANWAGVEPGVCTMAQQCGHAGVMEFNGDVYSCDHFVFPEYKLGNIRDDSFIEMMGSDRQLRFGASKRESLPGQCRQCRWLFACNGECPKNRFATTNAGELGLNYLCRGYQQFFSHVAPYMDFMKAELDAERPPANIMKALPLINGKR